MNTTDTIAIGGTMPERNPTRSLMTRALFAIAMGVAALAFVSAAAAQTETPPTETSPTEVPATETTVTPEPTKPTEPDQKPEPTATATQPGSGGIVVTTPEPTTPTPTGTPGGVAPGSIVVIVWSSDGGPIPAQTTVCIRNGCQSIGQIPSGTKVEFDNADQGWHDVTVQNAAGYADTASSVKVAPGQRSTIELTLRATKPVAEAPPTHASGPIRVPPTVVVASQDVASWDSSNLASVNPPAGGDAAGVAVNALPATGSGESGRDDAAMILALGATLLLSASALIVRRREAW